MLSCVEHETSFDSVCFDMFEKFKFEPHYEKTGFLHMRKQRRRSASR